MGAWTEPTYMVRRVDDSEYTVAKFYDANEPEKVYRVGVHGGRWWTDSPSYGRMGERDKHVRLVRRWVEVGEPVGTWWRSDGDEWVGAPVRGLR